MHTQIQVPNDLTKVSELKRKEEQKMHDVLLLLESLSYREEAAIKLIIECLYDIGSVNLINRHFRSRTLNGGLRLITRVSKPAFKAIAWRWYKGNCPKLIADWLRTQVAFEPETTVKQAAEVEAGLPPESKHLHPNSLHPNSLYQTSLVKMESRHNGELKHLRSQVRTLSSILVGLIVVFAGSAAWFGYSLERYNLQTVEQLQNRIRVIESSTDKPFATGNEN